MLSRALINGNNLAWCSDNGEWLLCHQSDEGEESKSGQARSSLTNSPCHIQVNSNLKLSRHDKITFVFRKPRWRSPCPHNKKSFDRREKSYFPHREDLKSYLLVDSEKYFPNDIAGENGFSLKSRNYFPSDMDTLSATDGWMRRTGKLAGRYFIELAIFIDRDLFKIMAENFPLDTEEHIIQVVLAMINAVRFIRMNVFSLFSAEL